MSIIESVDKIKKLLCNDSGVYHIDFGDRFGSETIMVCCVTVGDSERVKKILSDKFDGYYVNVMSPIWGVGNLLPEYANRIVEMSSNNKMSMVYGSAEQKILNQLYDEAISKEEKYWNSLTDAAKREFINFWIKKQRKRIPDFANCGDKFLLDR